MSRYFTLRLDIDLEKFQYDLQNKIQLSPMQSLPLLIIGLVVEQFEKQLRDLVASGEILRFKIEGNRGIGSPDSHMPPNKWPLPLSTIQLPWFLKDLPNHRLIDLGWFEFTIVSKLDDHSVIEFERPVNLCCQHPLEVKQKFSKTVCKYRVRMGWSGILGLPVDVLTSVGNALLPSCQCPPDCLAAYIDGVWDWTVRFICRICGKSYYCECFRTALERHYLKALEKRDNYAEHGWPHKFIAAYQKSQFRDSICHLCRDLPSELFYCHPMYGSKVKVHYGPYIKRTAIEKDIEEHEAENEIRDLLGIPHIGEGWISERELLNMVRDIFPNNEVIHQSSPEWLGRQRLDIFIPALRLAIEYQGRQHYEPVPFFGGEGGFQQTRERDRLKARLCSENGISLVFFRYDEMLTRELVETRIKRVIDTK
jgi:hypothetical protein